MLYNVIIISQVAPLSTDKIFQIMSTMYIYTLEDTVQKSMLDIIPDLSQISIITLIVNGLNAPSKRHRLAEWIQIKTHIYSVYKCQEAFNKRLPVCCFGSVRNPLALIDS